MLVYEIQLQTSRNFVSSSTPDDTEPGDYAEDLIRPADGSEDEEVEVDLSESDSVEDSESGSDSKSDSEEDNSSDSAGKDSLEDVMIDKMGKIAEEEIAKMPEEDREDAVVAVDEEDVLDDEQSSNGTLREYVDLNDEKNVEKVFKMIADEKSDIESEGRLLEEPYQSDEEPSTEEPPIDQSDDDFSSKEPSSSEGEGEEQSKEETTISEDTEEPDIEETTIAEDSEEPEPGEETTISDDSEEPHNDSDSEETTISEDSEELDIEEPPSDNHYQDVRFRSKSKLKPKASIEQDKDITNGESDNGTVKVLRRQYKPLIGLEKYNFN